MTYTSMRDVLAFTLAVVTGAAAAYLSILGGFGWLVAAGPYAVLIVPCIAVFLADKNKLLVWQTCIFSFVLYILGNQIHMGLRIPILLFKLAFAIWALGTLASSPAPIVWFLLRFKGWKRYVGGLTAILAAFALWLLVNRVTRH
jgi:hypothetical protein